MRPAWSVETAERRFLRLRGCFPVEFVVAFASGHSMLPRFPEVREKSETFERKAFFGNKTAGRGRVRARSGRPISVFPRTSGIAARKYAANLAIPEHTALFAQRNRRQRRCGISVCSACFEFAAYFRFLPLR